MEFVIIFLLLLPAFSITNEPTINKTTNSSNITTTLIGTSGKSLEADRIINACSQHECMELLKSEFSFAVNTSEGEKECRKEESSCREALAVAVAGHGFWKTFGIVFILLTVISCFYYYCCCYFCAYLNSHEEHRARCFSS